jgi:hypothetical protein
MKLKKTLLPKISNFEKNYMLIVVAFLTGNHELS